MIGQLAPLGRHGLKAGRRVDQVCLLTHLCADGCMRTNQHALAALDAKIRLPHRNLLRDVALLPLSGGHWIGAVGGEGADREIVAAAGNDLRSYLTHELWGFRRNGWW